MSRVTIAVLAVLLMSSAASAQGSIIQAQLQLGELENLVAISHGVSGLSVTSLDIGNHQNIDAFHDTSASQSQTGFLLQVANAEADSGLIVVLQALGTGGLQAQVIGIGHASMGQAQTQSLVGVQSVSKDPISGAASGTAFQVGDLHSSQFGQNTAAESHQTSDITTFQVSTYVGEAGDGGVVGSSVLGFTEQTQSVSVL